MNTALSAKDIVFIVGFLIMICKIVYDAGYQSAIIKQNVSDIIEFKDKVKRLHERLDSPNTVQKTDCNNRTSAFESRLQETAATLCGQTQKITDKLNSLEIKIERLIVEKTKDK